MKENFKADEPCAACGEARDGYVCYHHLHTQKAHSEERVARWNLIPVCLKCHDLFHKKGSIWMSERYRSVKYWLESNDWYILSFGLSDPNPKWVHDPDNDI